MSLIPNELFEVAMQARAEVAATMLGRLGDVKRPSAAVIASVACLAGPGDTVETGVLWGGSLLTTALLKKWRGLAGIAVGVDPLDGYYMADPVHRHPAPVAGAPISEETVRSNAARLGVQIELIAKSSYPWPEELQQRRFVAAFIDGDHWGQGPVRDFESLRERVARYIAFDNYPDGSLDGIPDIKAAVDHVLGTYKEWRLADVLHGVAILERVPNADPC